MKFIKTLLCCTFLLIVNQGVNAQFWKKLKKKVEKKIEQKIEQKIDKETDKVLNETLDKKSEKKTEEKSEVVNKENFGQDFGNASLSHSNNYGTINISHLQQTTVNKKGNSFTIEGNWKTPSLQKNEGYYINIPETSLEELVAGKTFSIPNEAKVVLRYYPLEDNKIVTFKEQYKGFVKFLETGTVSVKYTKDSSIEMSFNSSGSLIEYRGGNESKGALVNITGNISTTSPKYTITKETVAKTGKNTNKNIEADEKQIGEEFKKKITTTTEIPDVFQFNKKLELKMTDERGEQQDIAILLGSYPDIWGISMDFQGMPKDAMQMVMTPKASIGFMNVAGMKMKKATSLEEVGDQFNTEDKIPDGNDFQYVKTGNTKTIAGYKCEEIKVDYNYTNSKGSTSFWVSEEFPLQNTSVAMLGMTKDNPYINGFVLEMNSTQNGKNWVLQVQKVSDVDVTINSNEYKKMGF